MAVNKLSHCSSQNFQEFVCQLQPKITRFGGRKFVIGEGKNQHAYSLNQILLKICEIEKEKNLDPVIKRLLSEHAIFANHQLRQKSCIVKTLHTVRHLLGKLNLHAHDERKSFEGRSFPQPCCFVEKDENSYRNDPEESFSDSSSESSSSESEDYPPSHPVLDTLKNEFSSKSKSFSESSIIHDENIPITCDNSTTIILLENTVELTPEQKLELINQRIQCFLENKDNSKLSEIVTFIQENSSWTSCNDFLDQVFKSIHENPCTPSDILLTCIALKKRKYNQAFVSVEDYKRIMDPQIKIHEGLLYEINQFFFAKDYRTKKFREMVLLYGLVTCDKNLIDKMTKSKIEILDVDNFAFLMIFYSNYTSFSQMVDLILDLPSENIDPLISALNAALEAHDYTVTEEQSKKLKDNYSISISEFSDLVPLKQSLNRSICSDIILALWSLRKTGKEALVNKALVKWCNYILGTFIVPSKHFVYNMTLNFFCSEGIEFTRALFDYALINKEKYALRVILDDLLSDKNAIILRKIAEAIHQSPTAQVLSPLHHQLFKDQSIKDYELIRPEVEFVKIHLENDSKKQGAGIFQGLLSLHKAYHHSYVSVPVLEEIKRVIEKKYSNLKGRVIEYFCGSFYVYEHRNFPNRVLAFGLVNGDKRIVKVALEEGVKISDLPTNYFHELTFTQEINLDGVFEVILSLPSGREADMLFDAFLIAMRNKNFSPTEKQINAFYLKFPHKVNELKKQKELYQRMFVGFEATSEKPASLRASQNIQDIIFSTLDICELQEAHFSQAHTNRLWLAIALEMGFCREDFECNFGQKLDEIPSIEQQLLDYCNFLHKLAKLEAPVPMTKWVLFRIKLALDAQITCALVQDLSLKLTIPLNESEKAISEKVVDISQLQKIDLLAKAWLNTNRIIITDYFRNNDFTLVQQEYPLPHHIRLLLPRLEDNRQPLTSVTKPTIDYYNSIITSQKVCIAGLF